MRAQCVDGWRIQHRCLFKVKPMSMIARHKHHFEVGNIFYFFSEVNICIHWGRFSTNPSAIDE